MNSDPRETATRIADANLGYVWTISLVAAMGGLLFGYDWIVISGADLFYEKYFSLTSPSLLGGWIGLAIIYLLLGLGQSLGIQGVPIVALVVAAIGCYACTLAPVVWVVLSEIFPNRIRGAAMSVAVFALWTGNFTLTYSFPVFNEKLGAAGTFWIYSAICVFGFFYVWRRLPETKGKTLEDIERELVD